MHRIALVAVAVALFDSGAARAQAVGGPKEQLALTRARLVRVEAEFELTMTRCQAASDACNVVFRQAQALRRDHDTARDRYAQSVAVSRASEAAIRALNTARTNVPKEQRDALAAAARALESSPRTEEGEARAAYSAAVVEYARRLRQIDVAAREVEQNAKVETERLHHLREQRDYLNARVRKLELQVKNKM